jgi:hypothetical protein
MAYYLLQGAYTAEAWKTLVNNPVNRTEAIRPAVEKLGGRIESTYFAFGDYDVVLTLLPGIVYRCRTDERWTPELMSDGVERVGTRQRHC